MTLKELRKAKKITQKCLAERAGVNQSYICALEHGRRKNPSMEVVTGIARGLGVKASRVLDALNEAV